MEPNTTMSDIDRLQTRIEELGGRLIEHRTWMQSGDEIEERIFRLGEREVRINEGMRDGLAAQVKEDADGPDGWRSLSLFAHPEIEAMTSEQKWQWIRARGVPDDETYLAWMLQHIEKFVAQS